MTSRLLKKTELSIDFGGPGFDSKQTPFRGIADRTCVTFGSRYNPAGKRGQKPIRVTLYNNKT